MAAIWALLHLKPLAAPTHSSVLSVSLLLPAVESKPIPEPSPPRPRRVEAPHQPPQPVIELAATESLALTPLAVPPAPTVAAPPAAPAATPVAVPTQPRFDTDYLDNPKPPYPAISRRLAEQGRVVLRVHVEADGRAGEVQLQTSSGSPRLDQSALDTVRRWQFVPARLGPEPVAAWVLVPIAFTLKD